MSHNSSSDPKKFFSEEIILAKDYMDNKLYDTTIYYAKKDVSKATIPYNASYAYNLIGYSYFKLKEYDSSYAYYIKSIQSAKEIKKEYKDNGLTLNGTSYNQIGLILKNKHLFTESIPYFFEAIEIFRHQENSYICAAYYNLASGQSETNDISCIESYYKALEYATKHKKLRYEMTCMSDLGFLMLETNNTYAAIDYFNSALASEYSKNHPKLKSFCLQGLGESYYKLRNLDIAQEWAIKSLNLKLSENIEDYLFSPYYLLAKIYRDTNQLDRSEDYFKKAAIYFDHTKQNRQSIAVFKDLSDLQLKMGKMQQSSVNNERHFNELKKFLERKSRATVLARSDSTLLSIDSQNGF